MPVHEVKDKPGPHGHFDPLDCIEQNDSQATVEIVAPPDFVQRCARPVTVGRIPVCVQDTVRVQIAAQAVVVHRLEAHDQRGTICDKTPPQELIRLRFKRKR